MLAPPRRLAGRLFAGAVVLAGLLYGVFHWVTSLQWAAMGRAADALRAAERARPSGRVLLRPTTADGEVWEAYERLIDLAVGINLVNSPGDEPVEREAERAELGKGLQAKLGTIVLRSEDPGAVRELRMGDDPTPMRDLGLLAGIAAERAARLGESGSPVEAVGALLDVLQLTRDLAETERDLSFYPATLAWPKYALERMAPFSRLGEKGRSELDGALTKLIDSPPSLEALLRRNLAYAGRFLHRWQVQGWRKHRGFGEMTFPPGLRHGWSDRRQAIQLFSRGERLFEGGIDGWTWERRQAYWADAGFSELEETMLRPRAQDRLLAEGQLQLILMRCALRGEAAGKDPWGGELRQRDEGGVRAIWSRGSAGAVEFDSDRSLRIRFAR